MSTFYAQETLEKALWKLHVNAIQQYFFRVTKCAIDDMLFEHHQLCCGCVSRILHHASLSKYPESLIERLF
jgi:hypothetical protein